MAFDRHYELLAEIEKWENDYFAKDGTDLDQTYQKWLQKAFMKFDEEKQEKILLSIDQFLFHLNAIIQNSRFLEEERTRLLIQAKVYNDQVETIEDFKKLSINERRFIAHQQIAKQRLLSLGQGGIAGMGGSVLLGTDLIAMLAINLRAIQLVALSYGFEVKRPFEMMITLKLFHVASLPKDLQREAWDELWAEMVNSENDELFYHGKEEITDVTWLTEPIRQLLKAIIIMMLRKKLVQGIPLIGMVFGATINYQFSRKITEVTARFYEKRALLEKLNLDNEIKKETR